MPIETKEKIIGEATYRVSQLPAMRAFKLLTRLGKVAGPALAAMKGGLDADLGEAAKALFDRLSEDEVEQLLRQILETVQVTEEGKTRQMLTGFDIIYAGDRMVEVFEVVKFALEVQYGPIFAALGAVASRPALQAAGGLQ